MCRIRPIGRIALLVVLRFFVAGPVPTWAQDTTESVPPELVARLDLGGDLRVRDRSERLVRGRLVERTPGGDLVLDPSGFEAPRRVTITPSAVDSLWTGRRSGGRGAMIGGLIGAGLGAGLTWLAGDLVCDAPHNDCTDGPRAETWLLMTTGGAALGTGIGWVVGRDHVRWQLAWPPGSGP